MRANPNRADATRNPRQKQLESQTPKNRRTRMGKRKKAKGLAGLETRNMNSNQKTAWFSHAKSPEKQGSNLGESLQTAERPETASTRNDLRGNNNVPPIRSTSVTASKVSLSLSSCGKSPSLQKASTHLFYDPLFICYWLGGTLFGIDVLVCLGLAKLLKSSEASL
jgi:hypothetical protein